MLKSGIYKCFYKCFKIDMDKTTLKRKLEILELNDIIVIMKL